jgi:hypothetical protein
VFCKVVAVIKFQSMLTQRGLIRLGHKVHEDEWLPCLVETFQHANVLPPPAVIAGKSSRISTC